MRDSAGKRKSYYVNMDRIFLNTLMVKPELDWAEPLGTSTGAGSIPGLLSPYLDLIFVSRSSLFSSLF